LEAEDSHRGDQQEGSSPEVGGRRNKLMQSNDVLPVKQKKDSREATPHAEAVGGRTHGNKIKALE
jgi:hypothetical protein